MPGLAVANPTRIGSASANIRRLLAYRVRAFTPWTSPPHRSPHTPCKMALMDLINLFVSGTLSDDKGALFCWIRSEESDRHCRKRQIWFKIMDQDHVGCDRQIPRLKTHRRMQIATLVLIRMYIYWTNLSETNTLKEQNLSIISKIRPCETSGEQSLGRNKKETTIGSR